MVRLKIYHAGNFRRMSLPDGPTDKSTAQALTLSDLHAALTIAFPDLSFGEKYRSGAGGGNATNITFVDEEGDECLLETTADLREALELTPDRLSLVFSVAPPVSASPVTSAAMTRLAPKRSHPIPVLASLLPYASTPSFRKALDAIAEKPPIYATGVDKDAVGRSLKKFLNSAVERERERINPSSEDVPFFTTTLYKRMVTDCLVGLGKILQSAGVEHSRLVLVVRATELAFADEGVSKALFVENVLAKESSASADSGASPFDYVIRNASEDRVSVAAEHLAPYPLLGGCKDMGLEEVLENAKVFLESSTGNGDKSRIFGVRKKLIDLALIELGAGLGEGLNGDPARRAFFANSLCVSVDNLLAREGVSQDIRSAVAHALGRLYFNNGARGAMERIMAQHLRRRRERQRSKRAQLEPVNSAHEHTGQTLLASSSQEIPVASKGREPQDD